MKKKNNKNSENIKKPKGRGDLPLGFFFLT